MPSEPCSSPCLAHELKYFHRRSFLVQAMLLGGAGFTGNAQAQLSWLFRAPKDFNEVYQVIAEKFPGVPNLTTADLAALLAKGETPLLLDFRSRAEFEVSRLAGALWVANLNSARMEIAKVRAMNSQRKVVVYCSVGYRSADLVAQILKLPDRGYAQELYNLKGSLFMWANEGRPFVHGGSPEKERPAQLVHPYNNSWAALLSPNLRAPI